MAGLSFEFLVVSFELFAKPLPQCCQKYIFMQGLLVVKDHFGRKCLMVIPCEVMLPGEIANPILSESRIRMDFTDYTDFSFVPGN